MDFLSVVQEVARERNDKERMILRHWGFMRDCYSREMRFELVKIMFRGGVHPLKRAARARRIRAVSSHLARVRLVMLKAQLLFSRWTAIKHCDRAISGD